MTKTKGKEQKQEVKDDEKCLSEIMVILDKYNCELKVLFRQTKSVDQDVLAYGITVVKRK